MVFDHLNVRKVVVGFIAAWVLMFGAMSNSVTQRFISPLGSVKSVHAHTRIPDTFAFAPGWAFRNINLIDFTDLHTLAYFDLPALDDGTLYRDHDGYVLLQEKAGELVEKASYTNTNVVLTVSMTDNASILRLLSNKSLQDNLISEIIDEVKATGFHGVNMDFEYKGSATGEYREAYTAFVGNLASQMHDEVSNSQVSVSVFKTSADDSLFDLHALAANTDKVFLMAYEFAVPEIQNNAEKAPEYSYSEDEYWENVSSYVGNFIEKVPTEKLVMERAWYGNGNQYPLYSPKATGSKDEPVAGVSNTMSLPLSRSTIDRMVRDLPSGSREAARKNLPLIAEALKEEGILNSNVLAYALATIEHETAGTFEPIEEFHGRKSARRLGYEGGTNYFGRGFIQLTHLRNYKTVGQRIGLGDELVKKPELALDPKVSARILAAFFKDNGIAALASNGNFVAARTPVNPDYQGWSIANLAFKFLYAMG